MTLPKVLILNQPFTTNNGGGITQCNLFDGWDQDRLAVICSAQLLASKVATKFCSTYYQLGSKETKWIFPFKYIKRKYASGIVVPNENRSEVLITQSSPNRTKLIMNFIYPVLEYMGISYSLYKPKVSNEIKEWLDIYKPDVIYAQANSRIDVLFCIAISSYLKKPLVFHMMDDWPSIVGKRGIFKKYWRSKIDKEFRYFINNADILMSISDSMAEEYKKRYNREFITFHNPINVPFWKKYQKKCYELSDTPTIVYAGRIGLGIEKSLELLAIAVSKLNKENKTNVKFVLYTEQLPSWSSNYKCIEHRGYIPYDQVPKAFSEADLLFLPYDFTEESIKYIQYSMPTKGPEYMMSGAPIILFAPEQTAIVKYCQYNSCAKVISEANIDKLYIAIKELIENKSERESIAKIAKIVAEEKHDAFKVTNDFKNLICSLQNN